VGIVRVVSVGFKCIVLTAFCNTESINLCESRFNEVLHHRAFIAHILLASYYEGESNENRKNFFKFNLLNESGTQLYHFST
jgi:hypothetical protein